MATTTNYAWETPDDTDLVKDGAAAIRTLGSSIDTTTKALNPSTTLGDIEYRSATANTNTRLGIGSTGDVLTVAGGVPTWAAPTGGGKVLQVVQATRAAVQNSSSSTYADVTGLSATITPSSSSSKVLVFVSIGSCVKSAGSADNQIYFQTLRGATVIHTSTEVFYTATTMLFMGPVAWNYLDSPATTSATTYKVQFKNKVASAYVSVMDNNDVSSILLMEIGA